MCFNVNVHNLDITLCGEKVIHCDSETYLGVSLNSDITDRAITQTVCSFYQKIKLPRNCKLFNVRFVLSL